MTTAASPAASFSLPGLAQQLDDAREQTRRRGHVVQAIARFRHRLLDR